MRDCMPRRPLCSTFGRGGCAQLFLFAICDFASATRFPQPHVTSDLVPTSKLRDHGRGRDGRDDPDRRAPKSFVLPILVLSPLGSRFCGEFRANSMIPLRASGRGYRSQTGTAHSEKRKADSAQCSTRSLENIFAAEIHSGNVFRPHYQNHCNVWLDGPELGLPLML